MKKLFYFDSHFTRFIWILLLVTGFSSATFGATFTVTRSDDRNNVCVSGSDCSLREAIQAASSALGDDVIDFSTDLNLITLTNEIKIQVPSGSVAINGRGANLFTIDGGAGNNRIFSSIFANVTISGMTLTGGNGRGENRDGFGGAIQADGGSLSLVSVHLTGNTTGSAGGAVIFENGTYKIINSTFSANSAFNCGGISNGSEHLTIINSTISGNTAQQLGGGLCSSYDTKLRNVTITNNTASSGGGILQSATGTLSLGNTIVAGNGATEIRINAGAVVSAGYNLIGDSPGDATNTGGFISAVYQPTDILDTPPLLGSLQNNGGTTLTHSFSLNSPALDHGNNSLAVDPSTGSPLLTDQRGFSRVIDGDGNGSAQVDIGALELRPLFVTNTNDSGPGSLRQLLSDIITGGDAIGFSSLFDLPQTIILITGELAIPQNANFSINGKGSNLLTITGNNSNRIFYVSPGSRALISGITIANGREDFSNGGGILNSRGSLILSDVILRNNSSSNGGGIKNEGGTLIVRNSTISFNFGRTGGGGINTSGFGTDLGSVTVTNSIIANNSSETGGGGIYNSFSSVAIIDSVIGSNAVSGGSGGGFYNAGTLSITNSTVSNNSASDSGGGIRHNFSNNVLTIADSTISNNQASTGGGIRTDSGSITNINRSLVSNNTANFRGGGMVNDGGTITVLNSTVNGNSAVDDGGGILQFGVMTMTNSTVSSNSAADQGGGIFNGNNSLTAGNSIIADNTAGGTQPDFSGTLTSQGYNLIENTNGTTIAGMAIGNIVGQDPRLLPLDNYGGTTKTRALRANSPAVDKGNSFGIATDQRGKIRPFNFQNIPNAPGGNGSDIGAFERQLNDISGAPQFDFDGDGKADISVFRPSNGVWYLQQSMSGFAGIAFGAADDVITPADFDGDGKTDVAVFRPSNGTWYLQRSSSGFTGIGFGASGDIPMPADFDGDGKADLAVFRPSNGVWYIQGSQAGFSGTAFGANGDKPVAADYDGDGKADIAVFRPSNGVWYLQRSQLGFTGISFGDSADKPVPADYDGDGKTDIAVFRPSNGVWYLQQSTSGFTGIVFGDSADLPVPADYDGDGKTDISVFRPSNGVWYLNRSTQGFTGIAFGASGDKPIPNAFIP